MNSPFKNGRLTEAMSTLAFHLLTICDEKAENKDVNFGSLLLNEIILARLPFAGHTSEKQYQIIALKVNFFFLNERN